MEMNLIYREGTLKDLDKLKELGLISYGQFKNNLTEDNWEKMNNFYQILIHTLTCLITQSALSVKAAKKLLVWHI